MLPTELTYGNEGFSEIQSFLKDNYHKDYTLSIFDEGEQNTIEVICDYDSMLDVIMFLTNVEHDFPSWIGINELSESYVVGMRFTRGNLKTPSVCKWENGKLIEIKE